ncbi:hypothetical protein K3555_18355 [Leisingera sp. M527]|uniref:hypothetical protein n=1 Tax=Leisingera sp. M527 TaxID=2867014 RepID=UPI0021A5C736|nr:hypothetical protein [Leisingera sp. M527]UWQ32466.1 hypothetical protein K3555_18355 [Leisingera sp. M527]
MALLLQFLACVLLVGAMIFSFDYWPSYGAAFDSSGASIIDGIVWIAIPLFFGIVLGQAFRYVWSRKTSRVPLLHIVKSFRNSRDTYLSIFVSPLVFFAIYQTADDGIETMQTIALSFQNGFFVNHVIATVVGKAPKKEPE